jgi:hypothetical protein
MNDGVKILLERMQTNPEEFHGEHNRWSEVINKFEKFFNVSERALINGALTNIRREELTRIVMQELLRESTPVEVSPSTFTIKTAGRDPWGSSTLQHSTLQHVEVHKKALLKSKP